MIRLVSVTRRLGGRAVLDGATLSVGAGALVVVDGARAAGKSTLLRIAAALAQPDEGEVWIGDRDVARLQRSSLPYVRRNVGYQPPEPMLIPGESALENVMLALALRGETLARARDRAGETLERFGVGACAARAVGSLSQAEQRLVATARALAGEPPLLVLDDPAAGLGPSDVGLVLSALLGAAEAGAAVLCAASGGAFVTAAVRAGGRCVRLDDGRLAGGFRPVAVDAAPRPATPAPVSEPIDVTVDESGGREGGSGGGGAAS